MDINLNNRVGYNSMAGRKITSHHEDEPLGSKAD